MKITMLKFLLLIFPFLLITYRAESQFFKKEINRFNADGLRTGLWKTYWDDEKKTPMSIAHFENGHETGICKEFNVSGSIRLKSKFRKHRIRMKYYDEERKLIRKGWAMMDHTKDDIHFYWHGKWKFFDGHHHLIKTSIYENGAERLSFMK